MPHTESVFPLGIPIAPTEPTDTNPTHIAEYGRGGLMSVANAAARDAIPSDRKTVGMLVYVQSESAYYRLSTLPSTWDVLSLPASQVVTTVRNSTGVTIPKGSVVRISGATGNRPNVVLAQANTYAGAEAIGLVTQDITNNSDGTVTEIGVVESLNTSAFSVGDIIYLSPTVAGGLTNVEPSKPNWQVQIGVVTWSNPANGRILVNLRVESTKTEYITDMTATGEAVAKAVDQAAARVAIGMSAAGGDLSGSYPDPAVETRGRIASTTQYLMDGTAAGDFVTATADNATVTFTTHATMATLQGDDRSRCAIRHADSAMATVPTWELGQHAGVEVEASVRVIAFDTANNHQCGIGIWRFHTCPSNLSTIGAETLVGFYPKNGTWWVGVYVTAGVSCGNTGAVNFDTGISVSVDRLLRVVAFPGQAGALFYVDGVAVYRYSGAIHDPDNTVAYLGAWLQDRTGTSPAGAEVRVNSMVARHTMARNDPRLSDSRTPTAHKSTHAILGSDPLSPADIGAAAAVHTHAISDVTGLQTALDNKVDDSQFSVFGLDLVDSADAATARTTLGLGTTDTPTFAGINLASGEFISNSSNGRVDIGPDGIDPSSPAEDYMALTIDGTWGFGVFIGTRNTRTNALNSGNILFQVPLILNNDTRFAFDSSQNYFLRHVSGSSRAGLACGLLVNNAGSTGSFVLVQGNEVTAANRIPTTAHADPTLYLYGRGSANANDFVRANHDTTNGLVESGRGKLRLKGASVVRIEGPSGGFDLPATAGSNGQVMTTDGTNASWQTPAAASGASKAFAIAMAVAL